MGSLLPSPLRRRPYLSGSALVLVVALLATWGLRLWHVDRVERRAASQQAQVAETTLDALTREFTSLQQGLQSRAKSLANQSAVREGLQAPRSDSLSGSLVDYAAQLQLPSRVAVEFYDAAPRLRAWTGYSMPLHAAPDSAAQHPGYTEVVSDVVPGARPKPVCERLQPG